MTLCKPEIIQFLNQEVVPCWESLGAVPKVTVEFGNGKVLHRTLAGNIVLYLILPDGRVVDAYPGVYTPQDFLREIKPAMDWLRNKGLDVSDEDVLAWHQQQVRVMQESETLRTTLSKALVESPLLNALGAKPRNADEARSEGEYHSAFQSLAERMEDLSKEPATGSQIRERIAPGATGEEVVRLDSQNNRRIVRPAVHLMFAGAKTLPDLPTVRDIIYTQLLQIPIHDPYLGLADVLIPGTGK